MAVWKLKTENVQIKINDWDHLPPHCHIITDKGIIRINIETLEVMKPKKTNVRPAIKRALRNHQLEMLEAWQNVKVVKKK